MQVSRWVVLVSLFVASIRWQSAAGAPIGMPPGSKVWMKFEAGACPDADGDDCLGSNEAGPNPPNGIPLSTFGSGGPTPGTGFAEILPGEIRTFGSGRSVFVYASFEDTYTVGGTAAGPFDIPVELHVTGVARSRCDGGPPSICNQLLGATAQAEIGTFSPITETGGIVLNEGFRVTKFDAQSEATMSLLTESAGAPFERPIDITARYTVQDVNVGNTFVLAFGMNLSLSKGEVDLLNSGVISFDLPEGVFLTSALAESLLPLPGDFNDDGSVDAADYVVWRKFEGTMNTLPNDGDLPGPIDDDHYNLWRTNFGPSSGSGSLSNATAPEPSTLAMLFIATTATFFRKLMR